mmetsp:Transcript_28972/g.76580  ORF Transcript_28972/g.76580 Transcript_28972/m.76580 type:complete len:385 (+) Transcript_28972:359-1513(+)
MRRNHGDGHGADRRHVRPEEDLRYEQARVGQDLALHVDRHQHEVRRRQREDGGQEEEGVLDPRLEELRGRRADQGADQPADAGGCADHDAALGERAVLVAQHEGADPVGHAADGEAVADQPGRGDHVMRIGEDGHHLRGAILRGLLLPRSVFGGRLRVVDAPRRVADPQNEVRRDQPRDTAHIEGHPPAVRVADGGADAVAQRAAYGYGQEEDGVRRVAVPLRVEVPDHGRRDGAVGGLPDAHERPEQDQRREVPRGARRERAYGPDDDARAEDHAPVHEVLVRQHAHHHRENHVDKGHACGRQGRLSVREVQVLLDQLLHGARDIAVYVVQEVDGCEHQQRVPGALLAPVRPVGPQRRGQEPHGGEERRPPAPQREPALDPDA